MSADLGENGQSYKGVAPDGIAVNTALSESYITGLAVRGTEKGFCERVMLRRHICRAANLATPERITFADMNQPNGVLHISESFLYASSQDWPGDPSSVLLPVIRTTTSGIWTALLRWSQEIIVRTGV